MNSFESNKSFCTNGHSKERTKNLFISRPERSLRNLFTLRYSHHHNVDAHLKEDCGSDLRTKRQYRNCIKSCKQRHHSNIDCSKQLIHWISNGNWSKSLSEYSSRRYLYHCQCVASWKWKNRLNCSPGTHWPRNDKNGLAIVSIENVVANLIKFVDIIRDSHRKKQEEWISFQCSFSKFTKWVQSVHFVT